MNIFVPDLNSERCAMYHCDDHLSKMILLTVRNICTALNSSGVGTPYKSTPRYHPCVSRSSESGENRLWPARLARALNQEYRYRYTRDRDNASIAALERIERREFAGGRLTEFAQCIPEEYKVPGDAVDAYRRLYPAQKAPFARWTRRDPPPWRTIQDQPKAAGRAD